MGTRPLVFPGPRNNTASMETLPVADRINAEASSLLEEARRHAVRLQFGDDPQVPEPTPIAITTVQFRVTSRLAWVVAWVNFRRAADLGAISEAEVDEGLADFVEEDCSIWTDDAEAPDLPDWLRRLSRESLGLCRRVARLQTAIQPPTGALAAPESGE